MASLDESVKAIIVEQLGVNESDVNPDSHFVDDLGADSLDTVELAAVAAPALLRVVLGDEFQELIGRGVDVPPELGELFFERAAGPVEGSEAAGSGGW